MSEFISVRGVNDWQRAFKDAFSRSEKDIEEATRDAAKALARETRRRVWPAKILNIQDTRRPRKNSSRKPITVRHQNLQSEVELRSYWANARSAPVQGIFKKLGLADELVRDGLWVNPSGAKANPEGARFFFSFSSRPGLLDWASQGEAPFTWQYHRHAVRVPGEALGPLSMYPALSAARDEIRMSYDRVAGMFAKAAAS